MMGRKLGVGMASKVMAEVGNEFIAKEFGNMTKQNQIHVLADETLGGIKREYVETNRKAEVGDYIVTHFTECFSEGKAYEVIFENCGEIVVLDDEMEEHILSEENYRTLEPTDIVIIGGKRYRIEERQAAPGELILDKKNGLTYEGIEQKGDFTFVGDSRQDLVEEEYVVLEPVDMSMEDIIANLIRRVAELEQRNKMQGNENRLVHDNIEGIKRDVETWAQEVEALKHEATHRTISEMESKQITLDIDTFTKLIGGVR